MVVISTKFDANLLPLKYSFIVQNRKTINWDYRVNLARFFIEDFLTLSLFRHPCADEHCHGENKHWVQKNCVLLNGNLQNSIQSDEFQKMVARIVLEDACVLNFFDLGIEE